MRTLTQRELNRTLLARQLLLERKRIPVARAVGRLVAMQAQASYSPYVALWSRLVGFQKAQLTRALVAGSVIKAWPLRATLHLVSRDLYPALHAASIESQRGRIEGLGAHPAALGAVWPDEPLDAGQSFALAARHLGTDDRWTIAFTLRALPWARTAPLGPWPHNKPSPAVLWREPLPDPDDATRRVVHDYLAAYGPASRADIEQFTSFRLGQIDAALDGTRTFAAEDGRMLHDVPRARLVAADTPAPVRFLPAYDSIILAHRDRSRILPDDYFETVIRRKNATTLATFTVDGLIAGAWRADTRRGRTQIVTEPFERLPRGVRADVDAEAALLGGFYDTT